MMNILHLWKFDYLYGGGGAIVMYRLHKKLRTMGVDSNILCEKRSMASENIKTIPGLNRLEKILAKATSRLGLNDVHRLNNGRIQSTSAYRNADLIHFHGTHSGFINYLSLPRLTLNKPSVFTLHDQWAFTGHCAFSIDCEKWKTGCGRCPYPDVHPPIKRDATALEWKLKNRIFRNSNITFISLSSAYTKMAGESLIRGNPIKEIPNGVDVEIFKPLKKEECRRVLNLPENKHFILFSALNQTDHRKGGDLLYKAMKQLPKSWKAKTILLAMGSDGGGFAENLDIPCIDFGFINSEQLKVVIYSAADIFVFPSRGETFGLVGIESLACKTPVVAFSVGGIPDVVRDGETGLLAPQGNADKFSEKIVELLRSKTLRQEMAENGRKMVEKEFNIDLQAQRHVLLYKHVIEEFNLK
jgi:glycosyltransferase involved in cell wall biosynthesis